MSTRRLGVPLIPTHGFVTPQFGAARAYAPSYEKGLFPQTSVSRKGLAAFMGQKPKIRSRFPAAADSVSLNAGWTKASPVLPSTKITATLTPPAETVAFAGRFESEVH
jgi:hypothetical protein